MEEAAMEEGEGNRGGEVSPALIAVHPLERSVAVAIGSELRFFDLDGDRAISLSDDSGGPSHSDSIRAICFGARGKLFASAGDDKLVKIWNTSSWHCLRTVFSEKRVSAIAISHDGLFVSFADKFGVVWVVTLDEAAEKVPIDKKAIPIFGHYCSIITSLKFSLDGQFIASADRDFKIRISLFPKTPANGAHEIQSFCLGHTDFVSCLAFTNPADCPQGFLLSGSGDSTVRLWDFISGCLLDTCEVGTKMGLLESDGREEEASPAITDLHATPDGSLIAAAIQSLHGIVLLSCNTSTKMLSVAKVISMRRCFIPTSLGMSSAADRLWMVMGASNTSGTTLPLARLKIVTGFQNASDSNDFNPVILEDDEVPGGKKLLKKLQGHVDVAKEEEALTVAAEAVKTAMHNLLIKRQYSVEKRELRKKSRNDRKLKQ